MVHHAAQARKLGLALLGAAAALAAAGCGGTGTADGVSTTAGTTTAAPALSGNPTLGNVRLADCAAWRRGDPVSRRGTIRQIAAFAGGAVGAPGGNGATLPTETAYRFFDAYCANQFATYFKLYKLYTRAAAFTPPQR